MLLTNDVTYPGPSPILIILKTSSMGENLSMALVSHISQLISPRISIKSSKLAKGPYPVARSPRNLQTIPHTARLLIVCVKWL